ALAMPKSPRPNCFPATEQAPPPRPVLDHRLPPAGRSGLGTGLLNRATFFLFANANCEPAAFETTRNYLPEELRWAASAKLLRARFSAPSAGSIVVASNSTPALREPKWRWRDSVTCLLLAKTPPCAATCTLSVF